VVTAPAPPASTSSSATSAPIVLHGADERTKAQVIAPFEATKVLDTVFGKGKYLRDQAACKFEELNAPLASARAAGQVVPVVRAKAEGSFTEAGHAQIAYAIAVGECSAQSGNESARLVVIESGRIVVNVEARGTFFKALDLDGDRVLEIFLVDTRRQADVDTSTARLVDLKGGALRERKAFGTIFEDRCHVGGSSRAVTKTQITYMPRAGSLPEFTLEPRKNACPPIKGGCDDSVSGC
jgi:hypothetical protein